MKGEKWREKTGEGGVTWENMGERGRRRGKVFDGGEKVWEGKRREKVVGRIE